MQNAPKAVWSIPYISVAFFPSLKHNFIAYCFSKVSSRPDCIFEIHRLWQSFFSRVYSNSCCSCLFKPEIIKIGQSSHKMYSNNIVNSQESTTILNACTKKVWKLIEYTMYLLLVGIYSVVEPVCHRWMWIFKARIDICHHSLTFSSFLSVDLCESRCMSTSGPSSSLCNSFLMLIIHSNFLLCSFCSYILLQDCFVSFSGCLFVLLFNGILTFKGYLMSKPFFLKNSRGTI